MITRNRATNRATIWIIFLPICLAFLSANGAEAQSRDHEFRQRRGDLQHSQSSRSTQKEIEDLLKYGNELRSQILETLGSLVYDHYDELNLEQLETLYRIYESTFQRKYNIFDVATKLRWQSGPLEASNICKAVEGNVCSCIRNSSQVCSSLELLNKYRRLGGIGGSNNFIESIKKYFPDGLTPQALVKRLQKGQLRMTPKLLIGLLQHIQYDSFDNEVRRLEKNVIEHLATLKDSELIYQSSGFHAAKSVAAFLRKLLRENGEHFPAKERKATFMLLDHFERDLNSISSNIEHFGTAYENKRINLKYLLELVIPDDLVDPDIVGARNHFEKQMEMSNILDKMSIDKYEYSNPAQLVLEILRQMKYISKPILFPKNVIRALRMHADFWRRDYLIDDVSDFLKLFSAYDNLKYNPNFKDFFNLIEVIKQKLTNSKDVDLELTCTMPRPCLRRVLIRVLQCNMIDDDTKRTVLKFINLTNSKGSPLFAEVTPKNFKGYTPINEPEQPKTGINQNIITTPAPNIPRESKTTLSYTTAGRPSKYLSNSPKEIPIQQFTPTGESSKTPFERPSEYEVEKFPPNEIDAGQTSGASPKNRQPKKEIYTNDGPQTLNTYSKKKLIRTGSTTNSPTIAEKQVEKNQKISNSQNVEKLISQMECDIGQDCSSKLDSSRKRQKIFDQHRSKKPPNNYEMELMKTNLYPKPEEKQQHRNRKTQKTPKKTTSFEDVTIGQQIIDERTTLSSIQHTTNDEKIVTTEFDKIYSFTTSADGLHDGTEEYITYLSTESTESPQVTTNEYVTTELAGSAKYPKKQYFTQTIEETTKSLTSDKDCSESGDCSTEKCKSSVFCSEEGKTSENCNSSDESSGECESVSREQSTPKSCEGPDCSEVPPIPSSSSTECESSSEEKCSTESTNSCADGKCTIPTTSPPTNMPLPPTNPSSTPANKHPPPPTYQHPPLTKPRPQLKYERPLRMNEFPPPTNERPPSINPYPPSAIHEHPPLVNERPPPTNTRPPFTNEYLPPMNGQSPPTNPRRSPKHENPPLENEYSPPRNLYPPPIHGHPPPVNERPPPTNPQSPPTHEYQPMYEHPLSMDEHLLSTNEHLPPKNPHPPAMYPPPMYERPPPKNPHSSFMHENPPPINPRSPPIYKNPPPVSNDENSSGSCNDSDCSISESCEGGSCLNESNCDSKNCNSKSSSKCEGPNCSAMVESCEDGDCSSNSRVKESEEGESFEKLNKICQGPNCKRTESPASLNCESGDCSLQTKESCVGPNCPSTESLDCESGNCSSQIKESCTGPNCPSTVALNCESGDCSSQVKQSCTGSSCPSWPSKLCNGDNCSELPIDKSTTTELPVEFQRNKIPLIPENNETAKPKLCSTKDPNRKRKNERLQRVRELSNSFFEEPASFMQNNELPLNKVNAQRSPQNRKSAQDNIKRHIKPQLGPLLKGLTKKLNKNARKPQLRSDNKSMQVLQSSNNKQRNHSYPASSHKILNSDMNTDLNTYRRSGNLYNMKEKYNPEKIPQSQEYMIKAKSRNNNLSDPKVYNTNHQNNVRKDQNFDYFEYTPSPKLYQNRHIYSK